MDGIDVALIETDGERVLARGPGRTYAYAADDRTLLADAVAAARTLRAPNSRPAAMARAEARITEAHAAAVMDYLASRAIDPATVGVAGFHGQTVLHRPQDRFTIQLGDGELLARLTGLAVVHDFRSADVAAGGQGAPLVPVYHRALVLAGALALPVAVVNIGGVANLTYVDDDMLIAFDTGPGNGLLDDWALRCTGEAMDRDGALARRGKVNGRLLDRLLSHPFFQRPPPKSLDRGDFRIEALGSPEAGDGAATLTAFTAAAIARAGAHLPAPPRHWIVCGGGARNPVLMQALRERVGDIVADADSLGWSAKFMEAEAFAYLAVRALRGLPLTFPGTTGVDRPLTGGASVPKPTPLPG